MTNTYSLRTLRTNPVITQNDNKSHDVNPFVFRQYRSFVKKDGELIPFDGPYFPEAEVIGE